MERDSCGWAAMDSSDEAVVADWVIAGSGAEVSFFSEPQAMNNRDNAITEKRNDVNPPNIYNLLTPIALPLALPGVLHP